MNDKYLHYELEDFFNDNGFIADVNDAVKWAEWQKWMDQNPSKTATINEAVLLIRSLKFSSEDFSNKEKVWQKIDASTTAKQVTLQKPNNLRRLMIVAAIAASIALLFVLFLPGEMTSIDNTGQEVQFVTLPSGSKVTLYPQSSMSYQSNDWDKERNITLSGEADFDVTKGVPFIVSTATGSVRVLGTQFKVLSVGNSFVVDVTEGRVEVSSADQKEILTKGMSFSKNPPLKAEFDEIAQELESGESTHFYQYEDATLAEVMSSLQKEFGIQLVTDDPALTNKRYTGFYNTDNMNNALQSVFWPLGIKYEIRDSTIVLASE